MKTLEETLGVTLIKRDRCRVTLTRVGEFIVAQADTKSAVSCVSVPRLRTERGAAAGVCGGARAFRE